MCFHYCFQTGFLSSPHHRSCLREALPLFCTRDIGDWEIQAGWTRVWSVVRILCYGNNWSNNLKMLFARYEEPAENAHQLCSSFSLFWWHNYCTFHSQWRHQTDFRQQQVLVFSKWAPRNPPRDRDYVAGEQNETASGHRARHFFFHDFVCSRQLAGHKHNSN